MEKPHTVTNEEVLPPPPKRIEPTSDDISRSNYQFTGNTDGETCQTTPRRHYHQNPDYKNLCKTHNFGSSTNKWKENKRDKEEIYSKRLQSFINQSQCMNRIRP